jgi:hypothetical protein
MSDTDHENTKTQGRLGWKAKLLICSSILLIGAGIPFDAHVLTRQVNIGSQVSPGDEPGRLVGLNTCWVEATVPLSKLRRLSVPDSRGGIGSTVRIRNRTAWPEGVYRTGHLGMFKSNFRMLSTPLFERA